MFTRIKTIKGKPYRYEITTYRDPDTGKVRQKSRYLGKVEGEESGVSRQYGYKDRILYQGKPGRYLGEVSDRPELLYCEFDDGTWGTPPRSEVSRYPAPGEAVRLTPHPGRARERSEWSAVDVVVNQQIELFQPNIKDSPVLGATLPKTENTQNGQRAEASTPLADQLSELRDRLSTQGTLPGWIEERVIKGQTYYRYRWRERGKQFSATITAEELPNYRSQVQRRQAIAHIDGLIEFLSQRF